MIHGIRPSLIVLAFTGLLIASKLQAYSGIDHYPKSVYWGDTHLHTNISIDANGMGNRKLTPDDAYRFAKGEEIIAHNGLPAELRRPLDFLVVADHAVNMGVMPRLAQGDKEILKFELGKRWYQQWQSSFTDTHKALTDATADSLNAARQSMKNGSGSFIWRSWYFKESDRDKAEVFTDQELRRSVWADVIHNAESHYQPGTFTTFIGYEWTSQAIYQTQAAIHRVVIFRDGKEKVSQVTPFSYFDSDEPEQLWDYFAEYEENTQGDVFSIPHNSNMSNGVMFSLTDAHNTPITKDYATKRSRWEPLVEATQIKGDSETHPLVSVNDEFGDYETWNSWKGWQGLDSCDYDCIQRKQASYVRPALGLGLKAKANIGVNPFKFGMIGSTDSHTSLATADEDNFWGKLSYYEPSKFRAIYRAYHNDPTSQGRWEYSAAGYAAIWAEENTRESLFAAMKRKEVYASTGPRITVRFFGGWDYQQNDAYKPDLARIGYEKGVPMGGDLTAAPESKAPRFLIRAVKDPDGANLDRVQVIKGWHDANGDLHEKIYNVALSDGRKESWRGKVKPVGNTVDIPDASYTNTIGDPELAVVWTDPDFDKDELAFYYLRVLEIPTPRWTAYDAKYFKLKDIPEEVPMITQERAYTSPIWYTPATE